MADKQFATQEELDNLRRDLDRLFYHVTEMESFLGDYFSQELPDLIQRLKERWDGNA